MSWLELVFIGLILIAGLAILLGVRYLTGHFDKNPWLSATGDLSVALMVSVLLAPWVTDYLARERELEQRRWNARTAHLEHLRPILLADAETLAKRLSSEGHIVPVFSRNRDKDMEEIWFRHILVRDINAHFPEFFRKREELRTETAAQDSEMINGIRRIAAGLALDKGPNEDRRIEVAYSLMRQCIGKGGGIKLEIHPGGGYRYESGTGGGQSNSAGNPPEELVEKERVFREYKRDQRLKSDCERLSKRVNPLIERQLNLLGEARSLAELFTIPGDCPYTRVD